MHEPFICKMSRPIPQAADGTWHDFVILGLGSAGVAEHHLPRTERNNIYGLLELDRQKYCVKLRGIDPQGALRDEQKAVWMYNFPFPTGVR
jgi:hypothetical protein